MKNFSGILIGACAIIMGCSDSSSTAPRIPPVDHDVQGSWGEQFSVPGNSFLMSLVESSGVVTGTGSFAGEAGPFGSLAVSGTVANDSLRLRIIYNFEPHTFPTIAPDTAQFVGRLVATDTIDGQITRRETTSPFQVVRLKIGDPP